MNKQAFPVGTVPLCISPASNPWMTTSGVRAVIAAVRAAGGDVRFVGGAVRDTLGGRPVEEVDFATNLPPQQVMEAITSAGLKAVPTGLSHGTVTAVAKGVGYEITTLRHDLATDGRRAKVAFTDDWKADAARRDFTFNALYAETDGTIHDYFGGAADLVAGRVRFIGSAKARIREDVLRILRFFRFVAVISSSSSSTIAAVPDEEAIAACAALAHLLPRLSVERVWREMKKLLAAPDPRVAITLMAEHGILPYVFPETETTARLKRLISIELALNAVRPLPMLHCDIPMRRLAALLVDSSQTSDPDDDKCTIHKTIATRLRFSKAECESLRSILAAVSVVSTALTMSSHIARNKALRRSLYQWGAATVIDAVIIAAAAAESHYEPSALKPVLKLAVTWQPPIFPLRGQDLVEAGVPKGARVGRLLKVIEQWWIESDFVPNKKECLLQAARLSDLADN